MAKAISLEELELRAHEVLAAAVGFEPWMTGMHPVGINFSCARSVLGSVGSAHAILALIAKVKNQDELLAAKAADADTGTGD